MIRATIDTSALVPAIRRAGQAQTALGPILRAWRDQRYEMVLSEHILGEVQRTLSSPYFSRFLSPEDQTEAVRTLRMDATIIPITFAVTGIATHPEDDLILATALSGQVDYLVTLDRQLLSVGAYGGVTMVSPQMFLTILAAEV
ncbi:MAG: putative toxin-antitoxin system toxin component, PIN family [Chloroflexota bacterium]